MWGAGPARQGPCPIPRLTLPEVTLIPFSFVKGRTKVFAGPLFQLGVYL